MTEKGGSPLETAAVVEEDGVEYDESSFYPAKAESDDECIPDERREGNTAQELVQQGLARKLEEQYSFSEDVSCVVCSEVLVDPCTLHCGHSFCELCLANIWKTKSLATPNNLQCPVCREPWGSYPRVNIQLRNIIERSYGKVVELRRGQRGETDAAILAQYHQAKKKVFVNARVVMNRFQRQRWFIMLLTLALCGAVIVLVVLVTVLSGPGGEYMRKPVSHWSHEDVMSWLEGLGDWAQHNITFIFTKEKISGPLLLLLDKEALKNLGLQNEFQLQSLLSAVQHLKQHDHSSPRNFNEFLAAHRRETLVLVILYKNWPRFSFFYAYIFDYYQVFLPIWQHNLNLPGQNSDSSLPEEPTKWQLLVFGLEILLVPHYIVGMCAWYWSSVHYFLFIGILVHCLWSTQQEAKHTWAYLSSRHAALWRQDLRLLGRGLVVNVLVCGLVVLCSIVLWPIIPYFVCNIMLHWMIWQTAFTLGSMPFKLFRRNLHIRRPRQDGIP